MSTIPFTFAAILLITVQSQRRKVCADYKECYNSTIIRSNNIICSGQSSCESSTLTNFRRTRSGEILCSGGESCRLSEITAIGRTDVHCNAFWSCYEAKSISARDLYCDGYNSCDDVESISVTRDVQCTTSACESSVITAGRNVICGSRESCRWATINAGGDIECNGFEACRWATLTATGSVYCSGYQACDTAVITAGESVKLYGYNPADDNTVIIDTPLIEAYGDNSLGSGITIDSGSLSAMTVKLISTQSDWGGIVICRNGAVCDLFCETTGCRGLDYQCESGATCNIDPVDCISNPGARINGAICPKFTTITTSIDHSNRKIDGHGGLEDEEIRLKSDVNTYCDSDSECSGQSIEGSEMYLYCRGSDSCSSTIIDIQFAACEGASACDSADFSVSSNVHCNGDGACNGANIEASYAYCSANQACANSNIVIAPFGTTYFCRGTKSCLNANIESTTTSYFSNCNGIRSCQGATINASQPLFGCDGQETCLGATITTTEEIGCGGKLSCKDATISGQSGSSEIYGYLAGFGATINYHGDKITVSAYQGLAYSVLDGQGADNLIVDLNARHAMYGGTFICRSGGVCDVRCDGTSCENMDYLCETGATCDVSPSACASGTRTSVQGTICPNITNVANAEIDGILEWKKMERESDEIYMQIQEMLNKYVDDEDDDQLLLFGEVGISEQALSYMDGQVFILGVIGVFGLITLILLCYKMKVNDNEYKAIK